MADATGSSDGSGAAGADGEQSFAPAALRAGVKLQPGGQIKISVIGVSGKPLPGGRKPRYVGPPGSGSGDGSGDVDPSQGVNNADGGGGAEGDDVHILSAEVRGIGNDLLPNQAVRIHALDDGKLIGQGTTDENGILRFDVPRETNYRIELVDEEPAATDASGSGDAWGQPEPTPLVAFFFDANGAPLGSETISVKSGDHTFEATTEGDGAIRVSGGLQAYELTVRGKTFTAHALPAADHDAGATYEFHLDATDATGAAEAA